MNLLHVVLFAVAISLSGSCKPRRELGSASSLNTLSKEDIDAILQAKDTYDKSTEKLLIFVMSEDRLTDQGETFFEDFRLLVENHIGTNYKLMILTSGTPTWLFRLGNSSSFPAEIVLRKDRIGPNDIRSLPSAVESWRSKNQGDGPNKKKLQIIFHLLAHGTSKTGTGEGGVAIGNDMMSFNEIARDLLQPLAKLSDELIAIIEPCYGGNIRWNVPQNFLTANNAMLIFGAPPWAPQLAPSSDRPDEVPSMFPGSPDGPRDSRSIATLATKKALMGFASDMNNSQVVKFSDQAPLKILAGTTAEKSLQERHVVRVDEFKKYVEAESTRMNCVSAANGRAMTIGEICSSGKIPSSIQMGIGLDDGHSEVRKSLINQLKAGETSFATFIRTQHAIPSVTVFTPLGKSASLNPAPTAPNGILSVVNVVEFERSLEDQTAGVGGFSNQGRSDMSATVSARDSCLNTLEQQSQDLFAVMTWVIAKGGSKQDQPTICRSYATSSTTDWGGGDSPNPGPSRRPDPFPGSNPDPFPGGNQNPFPNGDSGPIVPGSNSNNGSGASEAP